MSDRRLKFPADEAGLDLQTAWLKFDTSGREFWQQMDALVDMLDATKKALDEFLPAEMSEIVMTVNSGETEYAPYRRDRESEEKLLDRFRDPVDPLKILIVTSKLLTGFDAPILQAMYLDKPMRDHTLLQAICRTNRPYGEAKTHGLIVDYLGVFDDVAQAIQFDGEGMSSRHQEY